MHCETFVQVSVVGIKQAGYWLVAAQYAIDEQTQLFLEHRARIEKTAGLPEDCTIGRYFIKLGKIEPLRRKIINKRAGFFICEHTPDLGLQHSGFMQLAGIGEREQFVIRQTAPEEKRQT